MTDKLNDKLAKLTAEAPVLLAKLDSDIAKIGELSAALDAKFASSSKLLDEVIESRKEPAR
jgi:hypothetical protein